MALRKDQERKRPYHQRLSTEQRAPAVIKFLEKNGPSQAVEIGKHFKLSSSGVTAMMRKMVDRRLVTVDKSHGFPRYSANSKPRKGGRVMDDMNQERMIAEASIQLFGEVKANDLLSWMQWVNLTKEIMNG